MGPPEADKATGGGSVLPGGGGVVPPEGDRVSEADVLAAKAAGPPAKKAKQLAPRPPIGPPPKFLSPPARPPV
eukprot:9268010-Pyramimonas_sp.AAC.1